MENQSKEPNAAPQVENKQKDVYSIESGSDDSSSLSSHHSIPAEKKKEMKKEKRLKKKADQKVD